MSTLTRRHTIGCTLPTRQNQSLLFWTCLTLLSAAGFVLIIYSTPWGVGLTLDSVSYIGGARGLLAGKGYAMNIGNDTWRALVTYLPGFPLLLVLAGIFGLDPLDSARFVQAGLFAVNIALTGIVIRTTTGGMTWPALVGALLVLFSPDMLRLHAFAWSEPLFLTLILIAFGMLGAFLDRSQWSMLIGAGIALGLAYLTRYAALFFIALAPLTVLLIGGETPKRRIIASLVLLGLSSIALIGWEVRNRMLEISPRKPLAWHAVTQAELHRGLRTVRGWIVPDGSSAGVLVVAAGTGVVGAVGSWLIARRSTPSHGGALGTPPTLLSIAAAGYILFILLAITLYDSRIPLDFRILSPAFILLVIAGGCWLSRGRRSVIGVAIACALLPLYAAASVSHVQTMRRTGLGFTAPRWRQSQALDAITRIPANHLIYTNCPQNVLLHTGRRCGSVPAKTDVLTGGANPRLEIELERMGRHLEQRRAVLVLLRNMRPRKGLIGEAELLARFNLRAAATFEDGIIYEWNATETVKP